MSTLSVATITTPDDFSDLVIRTANNLGPSLVMSSANDKIFLNGTLDGLDFPEVRDAVNTAYAAADTANASDDIAVAAFDKANAANIIAVNAFSKANAASDIAVNAFSKANAALANATGTFAGTLTVTERLNVSTLGEWPIATVFATDTVSSRAAYLSRRARGTISNPTVVTADTNLGGVEAGGYNGSNYTSGWNGGGAVFIFASDTWTLTSNPTYITFQTTPVNSTSPAQRMRISPAGNVSIGTTDTAGLLTVNGDIDPASSNVYDLGSSTRRWRNIYTGDLHLANKFGDYTIVEGEDDLFLYNNKKGKIYKFALIEVDANTAPPKSI